jgi:riboflavin synthase
MMFSGIIEYIGQVGLLQRRGNSAQLQLISPLAAQLNIGDSVSVNGVCLTVVTQDERRFTVQIAPETMRRTNLCKLRPGEEVNLEPALKVGDRLGGHLVQGHVDGVGRIRRQFKTQEYAVWTISAPRELMKYTVPKGSIAVDGVSLTVVETKADQFSISLIPHTLKHTILGRKRIGQLVNLEVDVMGKYVERMLEAKR